VSTLFSEEFYHQIKRYLKDDGILVQWVQAYEINVGLLSTIFQALGNQFGDYVVYRTGSDLLVVAKVGGKLPDFSPQLFSYPDVARDLRYLGFEDLADLQALRLAGRGTLQPLFAATGFPANSDFFPIVDQRAPRARFKSETADELLRMREVLVPVFGLLDGDWPTPLQRVQKAGLNRPLRVDRTLTAAESIGVALSGSAESARTLTFNQRSAAVLVYKLADNCDGARGEWVDALTEVVRVASPYLAPKDVAVLFDKARASRCYKSLDEDLRHHVLLLQAINERNATALLEHGAFLLERTPGEREPEHSLYLVAALAGALASGRVEQGRALRDRYVPALAKPQRDSLVLNLLLAHLAQPGGARAR
jgi:hypothetical protein